MIWNENLYGRKNSGHAMPNDEGTFIIPTCMVAPTTKELLFRMTNEY